MSELYDVDDFKTPQQREEQDDQTDTSPLTQEQPDNEFISKNNLTHSDIAYYAADTRRRNQGLGASSIMEEDEAKRYQNALEPKNQQSNDILNQSTTNNENQEESKAESKSEDRQQQHSFEPVEHKETKNEIDLLKEELRNEKEKRENFEKKLDEFKKQIEDLNDLLKKQNEDNTPKEEKESNQQSNKQSTDSNVQNNLPQKPDVPASNQIIDGEFIVIPQTPTPDNQTTSNPANQPTDRIPPGSGHYVNRTPEQRHTMLQEELNVLQSKLDRGETLTDAEYRRFVEIQQEQRATDTRIRQRTIEEEKKQKRNEKIAKILGGVVGVGVAIATPAISALGIVGVLLGGEAVGKGLKKLSEKYREQARSLKFTNITGMTATQIEENAKAQRRNERWANILGYASSFVVGASQGYALTTAIENVFGLDRALVKHSTSSVDTHISSQNTNPTIDTHTPTQTTNPPILPESPSPAPTIPDQVAQPIVENISGNSSALFENSTFNITDLDWNAQTLGIRGNTVFLEGSIDGSNQGQFFRELGRLVPRSLLDGQANANKIIPYWRSLYNNANPIEAAQAAAQALLGS